MALLDNETINHFAKVNKSSYFRYLTTSITLYQGAYMCKIAHSNQSYYIFKKPSKIGWGF